MASTATTAEKKRVARHFPEDVATDGDIDLIDELCTADVVDRSPLGEVRGREDLKAHLSNIRRAFDDHSATVEDVIAEWDIVAMRVTLRGTHTGEFMGVEPTGATFEVSNAVFTRIEDGQIAERWVRPDVFGMLSRFEAIDLPGN